MKLKEIKRWSRVEKKEKEYKVFAERLDIT
jgi:hypothetical protein